MDRDLDSDSIELARFLKVRYRIIGKIYHPIKRQLSNYYPNVPKNIKLILLS